jgi:protein-tyrosine phosphatase
MFNFNFLKSKEYTTNAFDFLSTDIHSHILPGIDDGSKSVDESIKLIEGLYQLGFRKLIATPHIYDIFYKNSNETIKPAFEAVIFELNRVGWDVELAYSAEYYADEHFEQKVNKDELIPFDENRVLIETSFVAYDQRVEEIIFNLITSGYRPILAHPERYTYLGNNFKVFKKLVDLGCELQLNINSLGGYYGAEVEALAKELMERKLVSYLGTDLHNERHLSFLKEISKKGRLMKQLRQYKWKNHLIN